MLRRAPCLPLRPFIQVVWASENPDALDVGSGDRERLLPTGAMHLVFRTGGDSVRIFDSIDDPDGHLLGRAVVGGVRAGPYVRELPATSRSVGAMLRPGAALPLFGATAAELAGRHTSLEDLWGETATTEARERIVLGGSPARQLEVFESILLARLPRLHGLHPAVADALALFPGAPDVALAVERSGYSHRRFIALFRDAVGSSPKLYCRLLRFQRALARICAPEQPALAEVAFAAGYADQAHLSRDFAEFAGASPGQYRRLAPRNPNHLPIPRAR